MEQYISLNAIVVEIKRRISLFKKEKKTEKWSAGASQMNVISLGAKIAMLEEILSFLDTIEEKEVDLEKDEPVSKDLEEVATKYAQDKHLPVQTWQAFKAGAQWQKEHLWKDAQGDDLPEIDREVIALIEAFGHYKVIFAHRVDENAEIHTSIDGKPLVLHPKKHGKGGWNISNIKWWLDIELPKMEE